MRFEGIKKVLDGHFINRYDITYTTEDNRTKVYEIISRNDNVSSLADLIMTDLTGCIVRQILMAGNTYQ